jgi:hypothetical protein
MIDWQALAQRTELLGDGVPCADLQRFTMFGVRNRG